MVSPPRITELEQSGYGAILHYEPTAVGVRELINLDSLQLPRFWPFLYLWEDHQYAWLEDARAKIAAYADLALRQASHVSQTEPRIYNAPEGGVVIESRTEWGILTLLIESQIGLIVRSADDFQLNAEFNITPHSINELLARYVHELKLLLLPRED